MDSNNILNNLKDIHLPDNVSIYPLATGWYIVVLLVLVIITTTIYYIRKKKKKQKYLSEIYSILTQIEQSNTNNLLSDVSILLKRVAIMKFPEQNPHKLFGEQWLDFLDRTGKTTNFTQGAGRSLLNIYQKSSAQSQEELFAVIRQWLGAVL